MHQTLFADLPWSSKFPLSIVILFDQRFGAALVNSVLQDGVFSGLIFHLGPVDQGLSAQSKATVPDHLPFADVSD